MPRITLPVAEWRAVVHELAGGQSVSPPPGTVERIQALLAGVPSCWPGQVFALELDASSAEAVLAVCDSLAGSDPMLGQRAASVTEAMGIIFDHQQHDEGEIAGEGAIL